MYSLLFALLLAARPFTPDELLRTRRVDDVRVSPDGEWVSVTVRQKNLETNSDDKDIWLLATHSQATRQFTRNGKSEHARWSPDGRELLMTRDGQLWIYPLEGGDGRKLTTLSTGADTGLWSPDGRSVAFTSDVYPQCKDDACNERIADERSKGSKGRIVDHLFARHWSEWREGKRTHLFAMPASGGIPRDTTPGDQDYPVFSLGGGDDFAFTFDGSLIVHSKAPQREAWSTNGDLYLIEGANAPRNITGDNPGDDAQPRPSPDGRWLAWVAQARDGYESDQWKLKLRDLRGNRTLTVDFDSDDAGTVLWRRDSSGLVVSVLQKGRVYLESVGLDGSHKRISQAPAGSDFDLGPDGSIYLVEAGITHPPEVYSLGKELHRLSHFNDQQYAGLDLGTAQELWTQARDGSRVRSWLVHPQGSEKLPLLVLIHGGPQGSWEDDWSMRWNIAAFAARGYVVLATDFHGSTGYGQAFKEEISGDWGGMPYEDIMAATDAALKSPLVSGIGCAAGASFGGYMIDWIEGHTDRFKCLVSHDGVFDLVSEYGSTEELWFPEFEFRGNYWDQPKLYEQFSPSHYVKSFHTPALIVQGELDFRVPVEQGLGMFTALQRRSVESRLLYFPDEGHWVLKPRNSQLWYRTVLDWIDAHARAGSGSK